ncbi:zinc-binding dehydrogenase [Acidisoma sp. S159]|jgi:threonine dehydrogenase-like Zn-dependent dehydrogenase|uniref:zinc-dependent alcohol dehydrogenase family protein n=1 Tax=Acidisoma sp. S159 TaxID=1747225 RepID=UPI00131D30DE|nr:zinc-binding dehydrogenase [Acidisoma sp. S159]
MRGLVFVGSREVDLQIFPDPSPGPKDVVIEMKASGMCGSDLKLYRTPKGEDPGFGLKLAGPIVGGHEPCGIVVAVGSAVDPRQAKAGDRVMVHHAQGCETCRNCRGGWPQMCDNGVEDIYGITTHGSHSDYFRATAANIVKLPDELSFVTGAALACGTGTAYGALRRLEATGRDTIAVVGQGPVGLSATMIAASMGVRVIALDISPERLSRAKDFGAAFVINPAQEDAPAVIKDLTHGLGTELALDTSGSPPGRLLAVRSTGAWGRTCFLGEGNEMTVDVSSDLLRKQRTLMGSWSFSVMGLGDLARMVVEKNLPVESLFTDRWKLEQGNEAYSVFDTQTHGKGVFLM